MYKMNFITEDIIHLTFKSKADMSNTMMRFQETYESPKFKDTVFGRREFFTWYRNKYKSEYLEDWDGFNIPSFIVDSVRTFPNLTLRETKLIEDLDSKVKSEKYYVITSVGDSKSSALIHEIAHALFYLNKRYNSDMKTLIKSMPPNVRESMFISLRKNKYDESVFMDEAQAYLIDNVREINFLVRDWKPWIDKAKAIFSRYYKV